MKLKVSKKILFLSLALIGIGLFIFFLVFSQPETLEEFKKKEGSLTLSQLPVSSIYRYDFKNQEYVSDEGGSWQNSSFSRYIYDLAPADSELEKCYYFLYDNIKKEFTGGGERKCNTNLEVRVGESLDCRSQEESACTLYVYAVDKKGNQGEMITATYHVDWEKPRVGKVYREEATYLVEVSDSVSVNYCWLMLDGQNVGSMKIENDLASLNYLTNEGESHSVYARCADHYDAEKERYLNIASGELFQITISENQPPDISFCKIIPSNGTKETTFNFQTEVVDPDEDELFFEWDFGDGEKSNEQNSNHRYRKEGTFEPSVSVSDSKGETATCSTAWAVVSR